MPKFEIKNRYNQQIIFAGEFDSLRIAVEAAIAAAVNLTYADFTRADLTYADFTRADFTRADFTRADLTRAVLTNADFTDADFTDANLTYANLTCAIFTYANLTCANLTAIRDDFWAVLCGAPKEVYALRKALIEGRIDGSIYQGECACLVGTLANAAGLDYSEMPLLKPNQVRPAERFFLAIRPGDTPETNPVSRLALEWLDTFIDQMQNAFSEKLTFCLL